MSRAPLVALWVAWTCSCSSLADAPEKDYGTRPDWCLTLPGGEKVSAGDFDQKVVIVDFWASWCPPCRKEVPGFIDLQRKYKDQGLVVLGFSLDKNPESHDAWVKEQGLNYLSVYCQTDEGKKVITEFEKRISPIRMLPTTLVIDKTGKIVWKHVGYGSPEDFERVITPLVGS